MGLFLFTAMVLFTWFRRNWSVFGDLLRAVPSFAARAAGEGHQKPFGYYLHLLDPMLVLFIIAVAGIYAAICDAVSGTRKSGVLLVIYGAVVFLIYSAIPYKTPWLALNLWLPLTLLCGLGVAAIWEQIHHSAGRWVVIIAGGFLLATLAAQTKRLAFDQPADEKILLPTRTPAKICSGCRRDWRNWRGKITCPIRASPWWPPIRGRCRGICENFRRSVSGSRARKPVPPIFSSPRPTCQTNWRRG